MEQTQIYDIRSSVMSHSAHQSYSPISRQRIHQIFTGQAVFLDCWTNEDGTDRMSRNNDK